MKLENRKWKEFVIQDLFDIKIGKNVDGNKVDKESGRTAYITRKEVNNALDGFIDFDDKYLNRDFPVITIGNETAEPFVQNGQFYTGTKVNILKPKKKTSSLALFFIARTLKQHKSKYSYSYTINSTRLKRQIILLPVNSKGEPDYDFMEEYIRQLEYEKQKEYQVYIQKRLETLNKISDTVPISQKKWMEFKIVDIFNPTRGNQNKMASLLEGEFPLISAKNGNNGLKAFVSLNEKKTFPKDSLTLNNDGDGGAGFSYYQPFEYLLDSHVTSLKPIEEISKESMLFISRCITKQRDRFGHGYAINNNRIKAFKIMLPVNTKNNPDYKYMENYMKRLEYRKLKEYIDYRKR
jgi:hypothetical protein